MRAMWPSLRPPGLKQLAIVTSLCILPTISAITFQSAPTPNVDLSQLGRVGLAGSFDSLSLYKYIGQDENGLNNNGSQSILGRYPDGGFADIATADSGISDMCTYTRPDGTIVGVIVVGNFTSIGGQQASAAVMLDPTSGAVTPLPGITGGISTLFCDNENGVVYFGGHFSGGNSTNAIAWTDNWTNLPFAGFNGPVSSVAKLPNGHIVFGGQFTGIGNGSVEAPAKRDAQVVNIGSANITSFPNTTSNDGYDDPRNIICRVSGDRSKGWLLADQIGGFWRADFGFTFRPTKLRLYQSQFKDYGTKTFRVTFYPTSGIANFTYYDENGLQSCQSECPLPQGNNSAQDFVFVNPIPMDGYRIDISEWYGSGGGLDGIEMFQNEIFSFAVQNFNEPSCDSVSDGSNSTARGPWNSSPGGVPSAQYLSANLENGSGDSSLSVDFIPDIKQSGNYSIQVWTPGCVPDDTCGSRGQVNITGVLSSTGPDGSVSAELTQTNDYDKYDEVYYGYVDASAKPTVTLSPSKGQDKALTVVAWKVNFILRNSTGGLNGLFEYDPSKTTVDSDFDTSPINQAGTDLDEKATVHALAVIGGVTYAAGNFTASGFDNIMTIEDDNATSLPGEGLNDAVQDMYADGTTLYLGGNFTNTRDEKNGALGNVASYSTTDRTWHPLGAGVNGVVFNVVPLTINVSGSSIEPAIAFSGYFDEVKAFDRYPSLPVTNIAIWVPSRSNWLQNLGPSPALTGRLTSRADVPGQDPVYGGSVNWQSQGVSDIMGLQSGSGNFNLQQLPVTIEPRKTSSQSLQKRADQHQDVEGVVTGYFYEKNNLDITILGGHFTTKGSNGSTIENLALIYGSADNQVVGLEGDGSSDEAVLAVEVKDSILFAGGSLPNGYIQYDLNTKEPATLQPPALRGASPTVQAITARPSSPTVYFGGSFASAGALSCPALCYYDTSVQQWNSPPAGLSDSSVITAMKWASTNQLYMAGNMSINGANVNMARYNAKANSYSTFANSGDPASVPGPIMAFTATDNSYTTFFAAGIATDGGAAFVTKFTPASGGGNGNGPPNIIAGTWQSAITPDTFGPATVISSIQMLPSSKQHARTTLIDSGNVLLLTGLLQMPSFGGNASAALFNGTAFTPFVLATNRDGTPGRLRTAFVQNPGKLLSTKSSHRLKLGFVVLIALAIALALVFLLVVAGILAEKWRRRRQGYVPAPTSVPAYEKHAAGGGRIGDISPDRLFAGVSER